jgi:hypothetical protein
MGTRYPATWSANFDAISNAASWPTGRLSPTKYYLSDIAAKVTVIRRHHPLQGHELEVLSAGKATVVVRLADGSAMKLPRRWTDADGMGPCDAPASDAKFGLRGLRELLRLVAALGRRAVPTDGACGEIPPSHDNGG